MKEFIMKPKQQRRFDALYQRHLRELKLQGLSDKTIDVCARAVPCMDAMEARASALCPARAARREP